jgi:hypothetical protein
MAASQTYKGRHKEVFLSCFILFYLKKSRVDFHPDYCRDFKIHAENLEKIFAENMGRIFFLRFSRKLAQKSRENL